MRPGYVQGMTALPGGKGGRKETDRGRSGQQARGGTESGYPASLQFLCWPWALDRTWEQNGGG